MAFHKLTPKQKLMIIICISFCFFIAEIAAAFYTGSLALLADAFHYLNDLIGFAIALAAIFVSERAKSPQNFSFGWARAQLLGAFFNGVFLLALGLSIFLQSIERFLFIKRIDNPKLALIVGSVGLALNILSATILHDHHGHGHGHGHSHGHSHSHGHDHVRTHGHEHIHSHNENSPCESEQEQEYSHGADHVETTLPLSRNSSDDISTPISSVHAEHRHTVVKLQVPGHDLGMMSVLVHVVGDALNNIATMVAALVIWQTTSPARFYADPAVSTVISIMIFVSSIPLVKNSGEILMQSAPRGVNLADVKHDLEKIPGVKSVHDLHIWGLDQNKAIASAHIIVANNQIMDFMGQASIATECLQAYGIDSLTLQPKLVSQSLATAQPSALGGDDSIGSEGKAKNGAGTTTAEASLRKLVRTPNRQRE